MLGRGQSQHENHLHSKTRLLDYHDSAANVANSVLYSNRATASRPIASDAVETATVETETWLKFRDETEVRDFIKNSDTETRDLKFETEVRNFKICAFCRIIFL